MSQQIFLAFDYGHKRIGVAVGTSLLREARALTTIASVAAETEIAKLIAEWEPDALIVGLPTHMDGTQHAMTQRANGFAAWLTKRFGKPVNLVDERLSTQQAQTILNQSGMDPRKARAIRDSIAAQIILQAYLDELPQ